MSLHTFDLRQSLQWSSIYSYIQLFTESLKKVDFLFIKIDAKSLSWILKHSHVISEGKKLFELDECF